MKLEIKGTIESLKLTDTDVIVCNINSFINMGQSSSAKKLLREYFPNNKVLVLDKNTTLKIYKESEGK